MITWQDKDGKKWSIKNRRQLSALHLVLASGLNCFKVQTSYSLKSVKMEIFLHSSCIEKASWEKRVWKKKLLVSLHDGTALWKSEQEQLTGRTHPPEAQKYKPIFAQQTNNVLQLSQAGWCISKKAGKGHLQRGQWHLFVPSKSLYTPSSPAQGTSVLQPVVLGLVQALPVCSWNAAALLQKRSIRGASGSISASWKEEVVKTPCVVVILAQGRTAHVTAFQRAAVLSGSAVPSTRWEEADGGTGVLCQLWGWGCSHETWGRGGWERGRVEGLVCPLWIPEPAPLSGFP